MSKCLIPSQTPLNPPEETQKLDFESVHSLVIIINNHMHEILQDNESQMALKLECISKLKVQSQEFFEFSEHSVLSNLYWGIESIELATVATCVEERNSRVENSEKMLQVPAALDENGATMGISNSFLVCCAYFYLSMVEKLRENEWQVAMHFLQALVVYPRIVYREFAPGICQSLFPWFIMHKVWKFGSRRVNNSVSFSDIEDVMVDDVMKWMAKRYKPWLMYYKIMSSSDFSRGNVAIENVTPVDNESQKCIMDLELRRMNSQNSYHDHEKIHLCNSQENRNNDVQKELKITTLRGCGKRLAYPEQKAQNILRIKSLKDVLSESEPDSPSSIQSSNCSSADKSFHKDTTEDSITPLRTDFKERRFIKRIPRSFSASFLEKDRSALGLSNVDCSTPLSEVLEEGENFHRRHNIRPIALKPYQKSFTMMKKSTSTRTTIPEFNLHSEDNNRVVERIISKLYFTEELGNGEEEYMIEVKTVYEILNSKSGMKYSVLKDMIIDQLLMAISTSKQERVIRTSLAILSSIVTINKSAIDDIKRKGLQLYDLATALKRNVHEAVILIYLINPSPSEIKTLELLPCLLEVACASKSYKLELSSLKLTPPAASLMIIEVLVTAFDYETNSMHLAAISSPRVLSGLLQVPRKDNLEEFISLAAILVECMRFDGKCRKYISEVSPLAPFVSLLWSNQKRATSIALEFFNELLQMPRSSVINLLGQIQKQGNTNNMCALFLLIQNSEPDYKLLAANLLLQLEALDDTSTKSIYREEAGDVLVESLTCGETPVMQALSAFILSNLGGTYSCTGEPYTTAWLVKRTGLSLPQHKHVIKGYDFSDQCLQDITMDAWSGKIARRILQIGTPVFQALDKGLKSNLKRVARDCLTATAWLGCELVKGPEELRHSACEIILHTIEQYMHPGLELEERLLACLCIFNYTSGSGMKKIISLSEGVRESLRRLSNVTWMAEELLKVADYYQPNKWRISCVHSQIVEVRNKSNGAVTALIYYKGYLHSGHADGSIKVWDIKGQKMTLVQDTKEHKKSITCFALYEPGNCLLSGSSDRTIKIWQMPRRNIECIEVIKTKDSIRSLDSWGEIIYATTQSNKLKVIDASREAKDIFKNKRVKCVRVSQGKVYVGCTDSSVQELMITNNRHQTIKAPSSSWIWNKSISSVVVYKDLLYTANSVVEGSKLKDWRKGNKPQISIVPEKGGNIVAVEVVEDFVYLNCSTTTNSLQIWLRGTQHKVGRLSAGSKITSLLSANDMILCGTEKGLIKGWIPF